MLRSSDALMFAQPFNKFFSEIVSLLESADYFIVQQGKFKNKFTSLTRVSTHRSSFNLELTLFNRTMMLVKLSNTSETPGGVFGVPTLASFCRPALWALPHHLTESSSYLLYQQLQYIQ
eukprot:gene26937-32549_t